MQPLLFKSVVEALMALVRQDSEAALCLLDWARCALGREAEREKARRERRKPVLEPIGLRQPSLADMGINVVGCSACAHTPKGKRCPGCGNLGLVPKRRRRRGAK